VALVGLPASRVAAVEAGMVSSVQEVVAATSVTGEWLVVTLSSAARVRRLRLDGAADGPVSIYGFAHEGGALRPRLLGTHPLQGGIVAGLDLTARRLAIQMAAPETVSGVFAWTPRDVLLTRQSGELVLFGGVDGPSVSGLQDAAEALLSLPQAMASVGPAQQNPAHVAGLQAIMAPGAVLPSGRFRYSRRISGTGVRLISLPLDVRMAAQDDLSGLRILDGGDRQVPFAVVEDVGSDPVDVIEPVVSSRGGRTTVAFSLPSEGLTGLTLSLRTDARGFSRTVTVWRRGRVLQRESWDGQPVLQVSLPGVFADTLAVEIDNGEDAPLPLEASLSLDRVAVLAALPSDSRLVYGDIAQLSRQRLPRLGRRGQPTLQPLSPPRYDLQAVALPVLLRLEGAAQLGPPAEARLPGAWDAQRGLVMVVTVLVALVLLGVLGSLLRTGRDDATG
jgi:hypothetical protein